MGWFCSNKFESQKRLDGQVAIVTGCNTGIGKVTALDLARRGAHVVMACRSVERAEAAAADIRRSVPNANLEVMELDLASLDSIREFSKQFLASHTSVHLLINNAGLLTHTRCVTTDGFEMHFGANYLGHFLLTLLLLPTIIQTPSSRIVNVSSLAHNQCNSMIFHDINMENNYSTWTAYARSKLANILFTQELAKRLKGTDVKVVCLHPGVIQTDLTRNVEGTFGLIGFLTLILKVGSVFTKNPEQGAQTTLYCALDDRVETGLYYDDCAVATPSAAANNSELAKELWEKSKDLVNLGDFDPFCSISN